MISFFNADITYALRSKSDLRLWLSEVAKREGFKLEELNVILCSDNYLYKLNVDFLKHSTLTDIITFDNSSVKSWITGELYISLERVRDNAKALKVNLKDELHRVMVHGLLHLCGYSDKSKEQKSKMRGLEDKYLLLRQVK
ncbi:MAG: rRNA maturation RNase YbeY [Bacteroidetes bacterium]|nr:rRNA maturation RNase YbeY [Bacteroidota bacterium]